MMAAADVATALNMSNSAAIKLLQITDTHLMGNRDALLRGVPTFATLQAVQNDAQQRFPQCDGVLLTGDLVQDDAAGYTLIREAFAQSPAPVYCIPGNHDLPEAMQQALTGAPFVLDDHVIIGNWLLVLLNSWQPHNAAGQLGSPQLKHLDSLLRQHAELNTLICLHHHPIEMESHWLDEVGLEDADKLRNCLTGHEQVRGVLWGHVHQALDEYINGVRYMATPATCAQFLPHSHDFAIDSRPPGYRYLELHADGSIASQVIWLGQ
ncbi:MAG: 3',5'-cyclic-AMP phosphodiesterase [Steroidobacteraceae bacterium]